MGMTTRLSFWGALAAAVTVSTLSAQEMKSTSLKFDDWAEGEPPDSVLVVDGTIEIQAKDGNKALVIGANPITDASAQLGDSAAGEASIQANIFASKVGRSYPRFGVSVHGMSGHRLILNVPYRRLEIVKGDEVIAHAPFKWESDTWVTLKLEVRRATPGSDEQWNVSGKAWPAGTDEPADASVTAEAEKLKGQGKCAVWGTPFSETPIYFDEVAVEVESKPE